MVYQVLFKGTQYEDGLYHYRRGAEDSVKFFKKEYPAFNYEIVERPNDYTVNQNTFWARNKERIQRLCHGQ
tara:strand:+ start:39 stop:251 length:213 start_codon:yes stop_codon:yes gene_type:complete